MTTLHVIHMATTLLRKMSLFG